MNMSLYILAGNPPPPPGMAMRVNFFFLLEGPITRFSKTLNLVGAFIPHDNAVRMK